MTDDQFKYLIEKLNQGNENIIEELQKLNQSLVDVTEIINEVNEKLQRFETR